LILFSKTIVLRNGPSKKLTSLLKELVEGRSLSLVEGWPQLDFIFKKPSLFCFSKMMDRQAIKISDVPL